MKSRFLITSAILAATAAFGSPGDASPAPRDAQSHAAALLSGPHTPASLKGADHYDALSTSAHAAALLSGSRASIDAGSQTAATDEPSGEHPAVIVAKTWRTRGIDANQFIVAHPASPRWTDGSGG